MKCKCCNRESSLNNLRMGFCFDCATAESIIVDGTDMYDTPIEKKDGLSIGLSKVQEILKLYKLLK